MCVCVRQIFKKGTELISFMCGGSIEKCRDALRCHKAYIYTKILYNNRPKGRKRMKTN